MSNTKKRISSNYRLSGIHSESKHKSISIKEPDSLIIAREKLKDAATTREVASAAKEILNIDPADVSGWRWLAQAQLNSGKFQDALESLSRALRVQPDNETLLEVYIDQALNQGFYIAAMCAARHWAYVAKEKPATAAKFIAGLYGLFGKSVLSSQWGMAAALIQPIESNNALVDKPRLSILVLETLDNVNYYYDHIRRQLTINEGHNNLKVMLDQNSVELHCFKVDVIKDQPEVLSRIPKIDIVYNSITDVGRCKEGLKKAKKVCRKLGMPVINRPTEVLYTTRENNAKRLSEFRGLLMPESISLGHVKGDISNLIREAVYKNGLRSPIIVRPSGYQNGRHMYLIDKAESTPVSISDEAEVYVVQYHDVTFTDCRAKGHRFHPKYRAFMVNGKLYPAHLRMGHDGEWNVHGEETRKTFRKFPWLYDVERDFIENPVAHFEPEVWNNLEVALRSLNLDYFGVDFAICTESENYGKVVIFEANASMRSFLQQTYQKTPENNAAVEIIMAAHLMFCERAGVPEWDFKPPHGLEGPAQQNGFEAEPPNPVVTHILFSGDLQGHGFREWLWHELHTHNLKGWLRNLSDGRVEAVVCGSQTALDHLLSDPEGPGEASIKKVETDHWKGAVPSEIMVCDTV